MLSSGVEKRFHVALRNMSNSEGYGFWVRLAEQSKISKLSWNKVSSQRQKPTLEMLEVVAKLHPEWAFWMVTGITDEKNGHSMPAFGREVGSYPATEAIEKAAVDYFELRIYLQVLQAQLNADDTKNPINLFDAVHDSIKQLLATSANQIYNQKYSKLFDKLGLQDLLDLEKRLMQERLELLDGEFNISKNAIMKFAVSLLDKEFWGNEELRQAYASKFDKIIADIFKPS